MLAVSILAAFSAALLIATHHGHSPARRRSGTAPPIAHAGRADVVSVPASDAAGGERKVWIYRPGVPDSRSLPVVYFLHGLPGGYLDIASLGGEAMLDGLITSGTVKPFVLVVPDGNSTKASDPEWADSADGSQHLEDFVVRTLPLVVEAGNIRDRAHRSIVGFSMGGYAAMNIGLHHPDLYGAIASIAGYFDTDDESGVFRGEPSVIASNRPDQHLVAAHGVRLMLAAGADDSTTPTSGEVGRFATLLRAAGVQPVIDIRPGGHDFQYLTRELPRAFSFLVDGRL